MRKEADWKLPGTTTAMLSSHCPAFEEVSKILSALGGSEERLKGSELPSVVLREESAEPSLKAGDAVAVAVLLRGVAKSATASRRLAGLRNFISNSNRLSVFPVGFYTGNEITVMHTTLDLVYMQTS